MPTKTCIHCGKEFEPVSASHHCSLKCFKEKELAYFRRHAATFSPERKRAAFLIQRARTRGDLKPQPCEVCGAENKHGKHNVVAHHDDYARPLDVRWLCRSCHKTHHHRFGPGKNAFVISPST